MTSMSTVTATFLNDNNIRIISRIVIRVQTDQDAYQP